MKKCELLIPAGGTAQFIAAVENGADAVYIGGPLYNARIGAGNFTLEEMKKAVDYAHLRNVKVYVTMNTLMAEEELEAGVGFAESLYEMGVDALIIQDLGLGGKIKERMPDFELHLSTQATVYNRRGIEAAAKLGYERAVLARELSLSEIKECSIPEIIETEVFVHGALCMCYSGQCQLSRFIGGRSGNKGSCAQPCRLPYEYRGTGRSESCSGSTKSGSECTKSGSGSTKSGSGYNESGTGSKSRYPLSPKDLCMIDRLGDLVNAGVSSLKIEGRMKSPEYVATVTRIYRKYLDEFYAHGKYAVSPEDMEELAQIFNRGGFTEGYADGDAGDDLMSGLLPKNQGIKTGRITALRKGGLLADVELSADLEMGDVVEIHSAENFGMKVTYFEKIGKNKVRIGDLKEKAFPGDEVYRIVSQSLMKKAGETFANTSFDGGKFRRKTPVTMTFKANAGETVWLYAKCTVADGHKTADGNKAADGHKIEVKKELEGFIVEKATNRAACESEIAAQLRKTGNTAFEAANVRVILGGDVYIPLSKINEIRRETLDELAAAVIGHYKRTLGCAEEEPVGAPGCAKSQPTSAPSCSGSQPTDAPSCSGSQPTDAPNCSDSQTVGAPGASACDMSEEQHDISQEKYAEIFFGSWEDYRKYAAGEIGTGSLSGTGSVSGHGGLSGTGSLSSHGSVSGTGGVSVHGDMSGHGGLSDLMAKLEKIGVDKSRIRLLLPLRELAANMLSALILAEEGEKQGFRIVPYISNVTKGSYDLWLGENLGGIAEFIKNTGNTLYVGNIGWIEAFSDYGITVLGDYGLNICNSRAAAEYQKLGMTSGVLSLEEMNKGMGAYPLMVTEHAMADGVLTDRKGAKYQIKYDRLNHKTTIRCKDAKVDWDRLEDMWNEGDSGFRIYL